ncbi:hypothetical protein D7D82_27480, partial [Escherichia coli]|nr:hypothetical protein [Escherichia coli]HAJ8957093.1 hypothetical protein [Escherichia coli]
MHFHFRESISNQIRKSQPHIFLWIHYHSCLLPPAALPDHEGLPGRFSPAAPRDLLLRVRLCPLLAPGHLWLRLHQPVP